MPTVTVFTATYNRAHTLTRLFDSLTAQTCFDFEWLIVDDGSKDGTAELVQSFKTDKFSIRYIHQSNGGKHRAINVGTLKASGKLFFIVDSDDTLYPEAIEKVIANYQAIADDDTYAGVCGLKTYFDGSKVGGEESWRQLDCTSLDFRYKYNARGDMAEVFKTEAFRKYPFPEFPDEQFCPEAVVWDRIAKAGLKMIYFYDKIYMCEYLSDGLTTSIVSARMHSPMASTCCYSELLRCNVPVSIKIRSALNYWRFRFCCKSTPEARLPWMWNVVMPLGWLMHLRDLRITK